MSQLFHIHPDNPQPRLISQAVDIIKQGGVVVYPTDSGYAIGCNIGNKQAKERIERIRGIEKNDNFTLVCRDLSELSTYARVDNQLFRLIKNNTPGPYTFIFKGTKEVPKRLLNDKKKTIGMRVIEHPIACALLAELDEILERLDKHVDLIIHGGHLAEQATTVIDLSEDEVKILRVGCGDTSPFE